MAKKDFMTLMKEKTVDVRPSVLSAESTIKSQIVVLDQLRDLIPPLTTEELEQLTRNVLTHGVKDPLTVWETTSTVAGLDESNSVAYILIDGHNRYQVCQQHRLDYRINIIQFDSLTAVKTYMIDYQLGRRNLTAEQTSYLRGMRYIEQKSVRGSNLRSDAPAINVAETLATEYGVSSRTIKRDGDFAARLELLSPDERRNVLSGKQKKKVPVAADKSSLPVQNTSLAGHLSETDSDYTTQVDMVQSRIQKLANGKLTTRSCTELIRKAHELLSLLSAK